jgi:electron transfer flavoprotein alpha subunit
MEKTFLVVAETRGGKLRQVSFEAIQAAKLSSDADDQVAAFLIGSNGSNISALANELAAYGADPIYVMDHAELASYHPDAYLKAVEKVIETVNAHAVYFGHTSVGKDLAPLVAATLQAGQISDVTAIENNGGQVLFTRPLYAGKAIEKKAFTEAPWIVTIRPNNIAAGEADSSRQANLIEVAYPSADLRSIIKEVVKKTSGKIDLSEAKVIISGGRGVRSADGFQPLEELAAVLGGAVGASRGACDAGYCDYAMQIGQTGKVVTPEIYIACGISGAIQHLAGMSGSRVIIAINKDAEAPIFKVADYGIVGDLFEVVPLLTEEFRRVL